MYPSGVSLILITPFFVPAVLSLLLSVCWTKKDGMRWCEVRAAGVYWSAFQPGRPPKSVHVPQALQCLHQPEGLTFPGLFYTAAQGLWVPSSSCSPAPSCWAKSKELGTDLHLNQSQKILSLSICQAVSRVRSHLRSACVVCLSPNICLVNL